MSAPAAARTRASRATAGWAIFALAIGAFGIGVAEFATMGLLPLIAEGLGVTITEAGHAVTLYAIGVVVGAPVITALTARIERKTLLVVLVCVFIAGSLASTFAPTLGLMLVARFVTGLPHGVFLGVGAVVASRLVPASRRATAMARVMLGLTVANIVGVPAATALGAWAGWRVGFGIVSVVGVLTLLAVLLLVPRTPVSQDAGAPSMRAEVATLRRPQILLTLLAGSVGFGGMFAVYTYVAPTVTEVTGMSTGAVAWVLVCFGVGMTAGSLIAGPLVDRSIERSALLGIVLIGTVLLVFGLFAHVAAVVIGCLVLLGIGGSIFTTSLQVRLLRESTDAPSLAAAMNHAAFNLANALGAFLGGVVIDAGWGLRSPAFVGVALSIAGLLVTVLAIVTHSRTRARSSVALEEGDGSTAPGASASDPDADGPGDRQDCPSR